MGSPLQPFVGFRPSGDSVKLGYSRCGCVICARIKDVEFRNIWLTVSQQSRPGARSCHQLIIISGTGINQILLSDLKAVIATREPNKTFAHLFSSGGHCELLKSISLPDCYCPKIDLKSILRENFSRENHGRIIEFFHYGRLYLVLT